MASASGGTFSEGQKREAFGVGSNGRFWDRPSDYRSEKPYLEVLSSRSNVRHEGGRPGDGWWRDVVWM